MIRLPQLTPAQQAAGVDRVTQNVALLSGAGCGKTFVLARRFTELLLRHAHGGKASAAQAMRRLVALTFTDKAALEMSQRVRTMLRDFADKAGSPADRRELLAWLEEAAEARISTIHSFCASVLRAHAVEAGLDPSFRVCAETVVADRLLSDAAERAVLSALVEEDAAATGLLSGVSFERLAEIVAGMVADRARLDWGACADAEATLRRWEDLLHDARQEAQQRLAGDREMQRALAALEGFACADPTDKLRPFVSAASEGARRILQSPLDACAEEFAALMRMKTGNVGSGKNWSDDPKVIRATVKDLQATLAPYAPYSESLGEADRQAAGTLAALSRLAGRAEELYRRAKESRGLVDFDDLIVHTRRLLDADPAVREQLSRGVEQLLLDEAQDTDAAQVALLLGLLGCRGKDDLPEDGRLFLVGDAKQSIYRFRGAQVEVFQNLCWRMGQKRRIDLDLTFRTHPAGAEFINQVFSEMMMGEDYSPIRSQRTDAPDGPSVEILLAQLPPENETSSGDDTHNEPRPPGSGNAEREIAAQAALTAQRIEQMLRGQERIVRDGAGGRRAVRAGDIGVLLARMTVSAAYEREFQRRGIPYYVVSGTGFFQQQEVFDCLNALRAIDNPYDDVAFLGALRGAMFGLDDNVLAHVARTHQSPYLPNLRPQQLADCLTDGQIQALTFACDLLRGLARRKDALAVDELLRRLLDATGYEAALLGRFQGRRRVGNVRLLLDQARAAAGQMPLSEFLAEMDEWILRESPYEQAAVAGEEEDVVRLMTIHKAKGLEFPVVFAPDLSAGWRATNPPVLGRADWGLVTKLTGAPAKDEGESDEDRDKDETPPPLSYRLARAAEDDDERRERIRRYYVALTRHEDYLVLVGADGRDADGRLSGRGSFLRRLDEVLNLSAALDEGRDTLPYAGGRFAARLQRLSPAPPKSAKGPTAPGRKLLAAAKDGDDLAERLRKAATDHADAPPLLGPLPTTVGEVELDVTALGDFEQCPAAYRWRYELRGPDRYLKSQMADLKSQSGALDPRTLGTVLHRCMELYDFARPQTAGDLVGRVFQELNLAEEPLWHGRLARVESETTKLFDDILSTIQTQALGRSLAAATEVHRELDFALAAGRSVLHGQIDLLYRDAHGAWRIVDYKSDRVASDDDLIAKARRYELQLLVYALAVRRLTGAAPAEASLYFLRTGQTQSLALTAEVLAGAEGRLTNLLDALRRARRSNVFPRCDKPDCSFCQTFQTHT